MNVVIVLLLVLLIVGVLPIYGYSSSWGYWPSGSIGLILLIIVVLLLMGRL